MYECIYYSGKQVELPQTLLFDCILVILAQKKCNYTVPTHSL